MKQYLIGFISALFLFGIQSEARERETDAQKWERIKKNKEKRRLIESKYEACVQQCMKGCPK